MNKKILIPLLSCFMLAGLTSCGENPVDPTVTPQPITSIRFSRQNLGLVLAPEYDDDGNETGAVVGEEFQLEVSTLPRQAAKPVVKFSSTDEKVATVDDKGLVKAVGDGRCDIVASSEDGSVTNKCPVYVGTTATKSKTKKVAEDIKAAQADITVDTVKESVYWNNKRTKNDVVFEDTYFDRTMIVSKSNAYFFLYDKDTYIKTQDGSPSFSESGWLFYTNEYYDTYLFRVGETKNYMVADATSYISKGKSRFDATCAILDSFFTSGAKIATGSFEDILGSGSNGPIESASTAKRRGINDKNDLILSIKQSGPSTADREDEEDYYIPAGTTYNIDIQIDYVLADNVVKAENVAQGMSYTLGEDKYTNDYYLDYEYSYQNIELFYPTISEYQRVDTIFDL